MDENFMNMAARIAVLEARQAAHEELVEHKLTSMEAIMKDHRTQFAAANAILARLDSKITRYEGKFGGIILAIMSVWAFITGLPSYIWEAFKNMVSK